MNCFVRRGRDSNPWYPGGTTVFETAPFDHSGTSPWYSRRGEGGIRTRGAVAHAHAFQACSFGHSDTSPKYAQLRLLRNDWKNALRIELHSASRIPPATSILWFNLASCGMLYNVPQAPALGSQAPKTSRSILANTKATAHIAQGSRVT